jgi:hypothetical protein
LPLGVFGELHGTVEVVAVGQGQSAIAARCGTLEQEVRARNAFQERVPAVYVERHGHEVAWGGRGLRWESPNGLMYTIITARGRGRDHKPLAAKKVHDLSRMVFLQR